MLGLSSAHLLSIAFFAVTAALLLVAHVERRYNLARAAAFGAVGTVLAGIYYLLVGFSAPAGAAPDPHPARAGGSGKAPLATTEPGLGAGRTFAAPDRPAAPSRPREDAAEAGAGSGARFRDCPECPAMVTVPPGFFRIGSDRDDARPQETPVRTARVTRPFALARAEISIAELAVFAAATGRAGGACTRSFTAAAPASQRAPADCVSAEDADAYVAWLSARTGRRYRLVTAVEWEYAAGLAARAGTAGPHAGLGLSGFGGGVAEIVADCWNGSLADAPADGSPARTGDCTRRVVKDGFDGEPAERLRASARRAIALAKRTEGVGFRVAR